MVLIRRLALAGALAFSALLARADEDVAGSKDHPLLSRYPDSILTEYEQNYNSVDMAVGTAPDGQPLRRAVEGQATVITYFHRDAQKQPSPLQLLRNYQNAIKSIQGEVVYERLPQEGDGGETTLKAKAGGKEVWVKVEPDIWSAPAQSYRLSIVELEAMAQVVSANALLDALNKDGFIALYIGFDTGKAELKADGQATVREIKRLLDGAPALKLSIEGHTDNVGGAEANQKLSEARARAVMQAVVATGIDGGRLAAKGLGQSTPIADNRSEEGRARNRRVELVKR
ncbi:MAG: OmpA family protein [Gammaproteobacteria bacterium]|nr:OmpA family protein [Gammaproteobacteria bacterium]